MKLTTKRILPIALIALAGLTQAHEPSEDQASGKTHEMMSNMDSKMPMEKDMPMDDDPMHDEPAVLNKAKANKSKHNHRDFKGLPSDPTPESETESVASDEAKKVEGHNHRKKHK